MGSTVASQKIMRLGVMRINAELMPGLKGSPLSRMAYVSPATVSHLPAGKKLSL